MDQLGRHVERIVQVSLQIYEELEAHDAACLRAQAAGQ